MSEVSRSVGRFEILRELGRGGMAMVYLARQIDLDRLVALKELSAFHASDPAFAARFLRESRLAGSLSHPNIVTVHEYFQHEGTPYIAMEYIEQGALRPYVGRLSLAQVVGVIEGMLAGLAHAETKQIVHRDLKPENVMVTDEGRVKIADFGIAKASSDMATGAFLTATGTTVGTPGYMAPEQALAQEIGPWTDLYSLGVMAYEMLVGRLPFPDTDAPMVLLMKHVNEPVPPPRSLNPELDPDLAAWIERLLDKSPERRIRSATEAWDELEESVIRIFGARWRREARLPPPAAAADMPRPLTPAPFHEPSSGAGGLGTEDGEFQSFVWGKRPRAPAPPPAAAAPSSPPAEAAPLAADAHVAQPPPAAAPAAPEPPPVAAPAAAEPPPVADEPPGFVTFAGALPNEPVAAAPLASEPLPVEGLAVEVTPEDAAVEVAPEDEPVEEGVWEPTLAPQSVPAPPPSVEPARKPATTEPRVRTRKGALTLLGVGVIVVAVMGWLVAPAAEREAARAAPLSSSASTAAFELRFPAAWRRADPAPAVAGLELTDAIGLRGPGGGALVAGTSAATGSTLLPEPLLGRLGTPPRPEGVRLGPAAGYRYAGLVADAPRQRLTIFAIPTTEGVVTLACQGAAAAGSSDCERIASSVRLREGRPFPLGPDAAYAKAVGDAVARLNTARTRGRQTLRDARTRTSQGRAAGSLADAYASAAESVRKLETSPAERGANDGIAAAFAATARGYRSLASAARKGREGAYRDAMEQVQEGERRASAALAALKDIGYAPA